MKTNYVPTADNDAAAWATNFATVGNANQATYNLTQQTAAALVASAGAFAAALAIALAPETRTSATVQAKDDARASMEALFRPIAVQISRDASITNEEKVLIGVTVVKETRTPVPPPTIAPALALRTLTHGQATVGATNSQTGANAKPDGAIGISYAWVAGTAFTADPSAAVPIAQGTRALVTIALPQSVSGQKISLFARYTTRSGPGGQSQFGPWSAPLQFHAP